MYIITLKDYLIDVSGTDDSCSYFGTINREDHGLKILTA